MEWKREMARDVGRMMHGGVYPLRCVPSQLLRIVIPLAKFEPLAFG
jgi:hypothetical protein